MLRIPSSPVSSNPLPRCEKAKLGSFGTSIKKRTVATYGVLETFATVHGTDRFPVDVPSIAFETANIFNWRDPITDVRSANIDGFEGALFPNEERTKWILLYNDEMSSQGRIRFTQAHELGHYVLHRAGRDGFQCGEGEVLRGPGEEANIESQADVFALYLLMPIDDFRLQLPSKVDLDVLGLCATRYGVSLTAAVLKWIQFTDEKAMMVMSRDGFVDWAWSSEPAASAGAFYKLRQQTIEIPSGTLAADGSVAIERAGREVSADKWFRYAQKGETLREMKLQMDWFDYTLTLLIMPKYSSLWPPFHADQSRRSAAYSRRVFQWRKPDALRQTRLPSNTACKGAPRVEVDATCNAVLHDSVLRVEVRV